MTIKKYKDEAGNTYSETIIPDKIVGFSGIDPVFIPNGWSAPPSDDTSIGEGTQDHEKLQRLLGGGESEGDHYHFDHYHHRIIYTICEQVFPRDGTGPDNLTEAMNAVAKFLKGLWEVQQDENP